MSLFKINQKYIDDQNRIKRIEELKRLLKDSDFKVLPDYDQQDNSIIIQRQSWREEIRQLEIELSS